MGIKVATVEILMLHKVERVMVLGVVLVLVAVRPVLRQILKTEVLVMLAVIRAVALMSQVVAEVLEVLAQMVTVVLVVAVRAQLATF